VAGYRWQAVAVPAGGERAGLEIARNFGGSHSPQANNYYCVNDPRNPVVIVVFDQPPSPEAKRILGSIRFFKSSPSSSAGPGRERGTGLAISGERITIVGYVPQKHPQWDVWDFHLFHN
jgi:hypothetical protein